MSDLWSDWEEDRRLMKIAVEEASQRGREFAIANAKYYAAKTAKALQMKSEGIPVTLIEVAVKGTQEVAPLLEERDCKKALYQAAVKAIDVYRDDVRMVYDQIKREQSGDAY